MATSKQGGDPGTEPVPAQETVRWRMPAEMEVEREVGGMSGYTAVFPEVRGGICEYCGVIDPNYPSQFQYKLCPHYRGKQLSCSYCPDSKDKDDVINHSVLRILQHPDNPNRLIVHCNAYDCLKKHEAKWKRAN